MTKIFTLNAVSRILFLLITPIFFQFFGIGFIWHSIYWGVITAVMLIWGIFIVISPLFGRFGCGWFCFMGTINDLSSQTSLRTVPWKKPKIVVKMIFLIPFLASALTFYFLNKGQGITHNFTVIPSFLHLDFTGHYQIVWVVDITAAIITGLLLERRWVCKNLCFMGTLCAAGAQFARLIPLVDLNKCSVCGRCEAACLVRIPITDYIKNNSGLVTNAECIMCGKCVAVCKTEAIRFAFVWNRKRYKRQLDNHLAFPEREPYI